MGGGKKEGHTGDEEREGKEEEAAKVKEDVKDEDKAKDNEGGTEKKVQENAEEPPRGGGGVRSRSKR